jgi:hypothetical protein
MNTDQLVIWNSFLAGKADVAALTKGLQEITDKVVRTTQSRRSRSHDPDGTRCHRHPTSRGSCAVSGRAAN